MKRTSLTALTLAAAALSTGALAASGDQWSGTNRYREVAPIEVTTLRPGDRVIVYENESSSRPVYVERTYTYDPGYVHYYEPNYTYRYSPDNDWVKDLNPQTGHRIGDGLFNQQGPNDFGQ